MIYDKFENLNKYFQSGDPIYKAACYARDKAAAMPDGDHLVDGDQIIARVQSYSTQPAEQRKFEYHKVYVDVQVMLDGCERQDVAPVKKLIPIGTFDTVKDIIKCEAPDLFSTVNLEPGWFVVYFPQDNHRPNCSIGAPAKVRKVCMKVKI